MRQLYFVNACSSARAVARGWHVAHHSQTRQRSTRDGALGQPRRENHLHLFVLHFIIICKLHFLVCSISDYYRFFPTTVGSGAGQYPRTSIIQIFHYQFQLTYFRNFMRQPEAYVTGLNETYDLNSVMHYGTHQVVTMSILQSTSDLPGP